MSECSRPILYTAIGDSLTVGYGSGAFTPDFVSRYTVDAEQALQHPVRVNKFARLGATSSEILNAINVPAIEDSIRSSEMITLTAGANDLIDAAEFFLIDQETERLFQAMETAIANIHGIIDHIHTIHNPEQNCYMMRLLNLYNPFPNIPQTENWLGRFNQQLAGLARYPHIKVADIYSAFAGRQNELLIPGGVHPNAKGYAVMAEVLNRLGFAPLSK